MQRFSTDAAPPDRTPRSVSVRRADARPEPATFTIADAQDFSGLTRSRLYELISNGQIEARKCGRRTLLVGDSLRAFLADLPRADIRVGRKAA